MALSVTLPLTHPSLDPARIHTHQSTQVPDLVKHMLLSELCLDTRDGLTARITLLCEEVSFHFNLNHSALTLLNPDPINSTGA
jgi:hypothetical protein